MPNNRWPHQARPERQATAEHALCGRRRARECSNLSAHCRPLQQLGRLGIHVLYANLLFDVRRRAFDCLLCAGGRCMLNTSPAASRLPAQLSICMPVLT